MIFSQPLNKKFYEYLDFYYDHPLMKKIKDEHEYSVYMCKIYSLLLNEKRYLIAIVQKDHYPINHICNLIDLNWISFQARVLDDYEYTEINSHSYLSKKTPNYSVYKISQDVDKSIYHLKNNEFPIEIILLHTHHDIFEYPNDGNLVSCLETYQTIIQFK